MRNTLVKKHKRPNRREWPHRPPDMRAYWHKSINLQEVPRDSPTFRWRFVKCGRATSCSRSRTGRVLDWHAL